MDIVLKEKGAQPNARQEKGGFYSGTETAKILGISPYTLRDWRLQKQLEEGVHYTKISNTLVIYNVALVKSWLSSRENLPSKDRPRRGRPKKSLQDDSPISAKYLVGGGFLSEELGISARLAQEWQSLTKTDSIAAWVDEKLQIAPEAETPIGSDRGNEADLFGNYYQFCLKAGKPPKAFNQFSSDLLSLLKDAMGLGVERGRVQRNNSDRAVLKGVRLKPFLDNGG